MINKYVNKITVKALDKTVHSWNLHRLPETKKIIQGIYYDLFYSTMFTNRAMI